MTFVPAALRRQIVTRAGNCCEYSLLNADDAWFPHEPDHIMSEKHGGPTTAGNLALACFDCNRFKGSDIASRDPETNELVPLFDPRQDRWTDQFVIKVGTIRALTPIARATARLLRFNLPERTEVRETLAKSGRYPGRHVEHP